MKRAPMPARRSPLVARSGLRRVTPLRASSPPPRSATAPRRRSGMSPEEREARDLVAARAAGRCEGCGRPGVCEWAHRVGRAQGGPWRATNGLWLCGDLTGGHAPTTGGGCHPWSHSRAGRPVCERRGWILRHHHGPATTPVWIFGRGWVLLAADGSCTPAEPARDEEAA